MGIIEVLVNVCDAAETAIANSSNPLSASPLIPKTFSQTQKAIAHMMRESTGASILDSGSAYGRSWERNRKRDFSKAKPASIKGRVYTDSQGNNKLDLDITIDLFTYLSSRLDYNRTLTKQFNQFLALEKNQKEDYLSLMNSFPDWIGKKWAVYSEVEFEGNSYNEENLLSGTVQYVMFRLDGEQFILLQIHGGCDVRGGYTAPQVFKLDENNGTFGDWNDAQVYPSFSELEYIRESRKKELDNQLFLHSSVETDYRAENAIFGENIYWNVGACNEAGEGCEMRLHEYPCQEIESKNKWEKGVVCVLDGVILCPETGVILQADFFH